MSVSSSIYNATMAVIGALAYDIRVDWSEYEDRCNLIINLARNIDRDDLADEVDDIKCYDSSFDGRDFRDWSGPYGSCTPEDLELIGLDNDIFNDHTVCVRNVKAIYKASIAVMGALVHDIQEDWTNHEDRCDLIIKLAENINREDLAQEAKSIKYASFDRHFVGFLESDFINWRYGDCTLADLKLVGLKPDIFLDSDICVAITKPSFENEY